MSFVAFLFFVRISVLVLLALNTAKCTVSIEKPHSLWLNRQRQDYEPDKTCVHQMNSLSRNKFWFLCISLNFFLSSSSFDLFFFGYSFRKSVKEKMTNDSDTASVLCFELVWMILKEGRRILIEEKKEQ